MNFIMLIVSGVLTALSLMNKYTGFLAFFSLIPYIYVLLKESQRPNRALTFFGYGFVYSMSYFLTIYHWFWYMYGTDFLDFSKKETFFICLFFQIGLSLVQAFLYSFIPIVFRLAKQKYPMLSPLIFALVYSVFEFLQSLTWTGVPWARLALSQVGNKPMLALSSLFGSIFVAFVVVLINGYLALAIYKLISTREFTKRIVMYASSALLVFALAMVTGAVTLYLMPKDSEENKVDIVLVQTNIGSTDKWDGDDASALDKVISLAEKAYEAEGEADIILLPETCIVYAARTSEYTCQEFKALAKKTGATVVVGTFDEAYSDDGKTRNDYNALISFFPNGKIEEGGYYKRHLVPFGEYVPMRKILTTIFPFLDGIAMLEDDLTPGKDSAVIESGHGKIGRLICFDSIYPSLTIDSVKDGAELILLSTNDSWYRDSASAYQHNCHAVLRAVESGRWVARCATTGISSVISPDGEVVESLGALKEGYVKGEVYTRTNRTLYSYVQDSFVLASAIALVILIGINAYIDIKFSKSEGYDI